MQINHKQLYQEFPITSICRADLKDAGFDINNVSDSDMERLANKMANAYCDNGFWIDMPIIADYLEIPKLNKK